MAILEVGPSSVESLLIGHLGWGLRFNLRADWIEVDCRDGDGWQRYLDEVHGDAERKRAFEVHSKRIVRGPGEALVPWRCTKEDWVMGLNAHVAERERRVDPFLVWLEGLPAWSGEPQVERLLIDFLGAPNDELSRWAARAIMVGAIDRAVNPGAVIHDHVILSGGQGIGKTSMLEALAVNADWYSKVAISEDEKGMLEACQGAVIVEMDEMDGVKASDVTRVKSFLSSSKTQVRLAYRRDPVAYPRRFVLVGTSNEEDPIPFDPTGSRRFVAIPCVGVRDFGRQVRSAVGAEMEGLWAEAWHHYRAGSRGWTDGRLPAELEAARVTRNEAFQASDDSMSSLIGALPAKSMTLHDVAVTLGLKVPLDRSVQFRLADALKGEGWGRSQRRRDGRVVREWEPPDGWVQHPVAALDVEEARLRRDLA